MRCGVWSNKYFFILWYCASEFALSRDDVWLFGCTVSCLYLGWVSSRSELPDLLRWDSWSESEESEGGWHRIWSGLELRIKTFNYNREEEMQDWPSGGGLTGDGARRGGFCFTSTGADFISGRTLHETITFLRPWHVTWLVLFHLWAIYKTSISKSLQEVTC